MDFYDVQEEEDEFNALENAHANSCFSDESLVELAGTDDLLSVTRLEVVADTSTDDLSPLGLKLPMLQELKLNNSMIPTLRDLGTSFRRLQVLWVSRSGVEDLSGLAGLPILRELYAAFNDVSDLCAVADCEFLEVADFEANKVSDFDTVGYLAMVPSLTTVSLEGNPIAQQRHYRQKVLEAAPQITELDDQSVDEADRATDGSGEAGGLSSPGVEDDLLAALRKEREAAARELALISDGIKYARCGMDDAAAVEAGEDGELGGPSSSGRSLRPPTPLSRPGSARPASGIARPGNSRPGTSSRPGSAFSRPGSALSRPGTGTGTGNARGSPPPSQAGPRPQADLAAALSWSRPSTAAGSRPSTANSWGWGAAPTSSVAGSRPGSAMLVHGGGGSGKGAALEGGNGRPSSSRPNSSRLSVTSYSGRPGTASSSGGSDSGAPADGLFWRSRRVSTVQGAGGSASDLTAFASTGQREPRRSFVESDMRGLEEPESVVDANGSSDLTFGNGGSALAGNPAQALRARRSVAALAQQAEAEAAALDAELLEDDGPLLDPQMVLRPLAVGAEAEHEEILEELRAWKVGALEASLIDESELGLPEMPHSPPRAALAGGSRDVFVVETGEELHEWSTGSNGYGNVGHAGGGFGFGTGMPPLPGLHQQGPPSLPPLRPLLPAAGGLEGVGRPGPPPAPQPPRMPMPPSALPPTARRPIHSTKSKDSSGSGGHSVARALGADRLVEPQSSSGGRPTAPFR